tara:strand:- start:625 stop:927 length:303 start_codon:yes stop_codon:yes gene_type:complete
MKIKELTNNKLKESNMIGTKVYNWKVSNGDDVKVEYTFSSVDKCIKVVEMTVNGKFHRINWMSEEGRNTLMELLEKDFDSHFGTKDIPGFEGTLEQLEAI